MLRFLVPVVVPAGLVLRGRVIAIIPARYHATRLPGKPLAPIAGRPMIVHVMDRARAAGQVDEVVVATDDERIAAAVDQHGGTAVMTRATHPSGTDRLAEVAAHLDAEIIVNLQGDEPLLDPHSVDAAILPLLADSSVAMSTLRTPLEADAATNPNVVKVVVNLAGDAMYFTRAAVPYLRPGHPPAVAWRHLGLYVYRREVLCRLAQLPPTPLESAEGLEQLRALEHGIAIRTVEVASAPPSVDTEDDLFKVRALLESPTVSSHA
jgi:3-deoxy-manno-octulosonate cytidylyltransferase (CMP-KDO synthetase)